MIDLPNHVFQACKTLAGAGFQAYPVGGALRDILLGLSPLDWDITTDARPGEIENLFPKTIPTGKRFGTVTVFIDGQPLEITTMRREGPYSDGRHPDQVYFTDSIEEDLARRDFTINALAYQFSTGRLIDPFGGAKHLKKRLLIPVGSAEDRFQEDPLRMLRLLRFQAVLGFRIQKRTRLALHPSWIRKVSPERIQTEFSKMLVGRELAPALKLFYTSGLMEEILPELAAAKGVSPGPSHPYDLLGHLIYSAHFALPCLHLRLAALLHDIAKPQAPGRKHEKESARLARDILHRLRYSKECLSRVELLIANHMFEIHPHSSDAAWRRLMAKVGAEVLSDLIKLRQADLAGLNRGPRQIIAYGKAMEARLQEIIAADSALDLSDLAIDGNVVMEQFGIRPGPQVGAVLTHLLEEVLADPSLNEVNQLLELAKSFLESEQEIRSPKGTST